MDTKREQVIELIAEAFSVDKDFYRNADKKRRNVNPKKALILMMYGKEEMTFEEISKFMGYKSHCIVRHHYIDGNNLWDTSEFFRSKMDDINQKAIDIYYTKKQSV